MGVLAEPERMTADEFELMPNRRGLELLDGVVRDKNGGCEAGAVGARLVHALYSAVLPSDLGFVLTGRGGYCCFPGRPDHVRLPSVSFVLRARLPEGRLPRGLARLRPDIAVEVVKPADTADAVDELVADWFAAGVPLLWVVSPATRTVLVYHPDGTARRLTAADHLTAEPIVPDFRVAVADLFPSADRP